MDLFLLNLKFQLALYSILVQWYRCKAEKLRLREIRIRWKESGLKLSSAQEENKPITEFQAKISETLNAANKEVKAAQAAVQRITSDVDKLNKQDRDMVSLGLLGCFF